MKFILLVTAVVIAAGGGAYVLTGQPSAPAATPSLAGDWSCNSTSKAGTDVLETSLLMTVASNGATRGQANFNSPMQGFHVMLEATFDGETRIANGQLHETTTNVVVTEATVDGQQAPLGMRNAIRADLFKESATYPVREFNGSRLVYGDDSVRVTCQRSSVPFKL